MSDIILQSASAPTVVAAQLLPQPRMPISIRRATVDDVPFMDALQKKHAKQLGFFPRAQMMDYIEGGHVLVAEDEATRKQVGYVASRDRYLKRDELGVIFQMCVTPEYRRSFVAANLLREVYERSSYGCRLYCCWCAQDLVESSRFWESMGFVPIAYRAGSEKKSRVHIFWQKRIRAGDESTHWWFPSKTEGGAIREDRIVLPIPPGMRWDDALPVLLPSKRDESVSEVPTRKVKPTERKKKPVATERRFLPPGSEIQPPKPVAPAEPKREEREKPAPVARKCDPLLIAKARELRDKWLEQINSNAVALPSAKYDVAKRIAA